MSTDGSKVDPLARRIAIVPVVVIAAAAAAYLWGFRLEGRRPVTLDWRTHAVAESHFAVAAPGMLIINRQMMKIAGEDALAQTYMASDLGADFSVSVVRRPDRDHRPFDVVAKSLGLSGTDVAQSADGLTLFRHDVTLEGTRTQALVIFHERMMYQMMVTSPAASFPLVDAERFLGSFRLLADTKPL